MSTVMVVDNEQTTATLLKMLLELEGYSVELVTVGSQAIDRALRVLPDAFILDYRLDDTNGIVLTEQLRSNARFAHSPIIMTSGMDVSREAEQAGVNMFLVKPLNPRELMDTLRALLA